jgi:IPT/TIG domain-containing protein
MKTVVLILFVVLIEASIGRSTSYASFSGSPGAGPTSAEAPELNGLQLLFKGQPVDEVVSDKKIKKYVIEVTGTGFLPGSSVVVRSIRAFPFAPGEHPQQPTLTTFISVTSLEVRFLPDAAPPPGMLSVSVVNSDGVESNGLSVDVISKASKLSISSISPQSGPVGTQITLIGSGFTPIPANNLNAIRFTPVGTQDNRLANFFEGFYSDAIVDNGTITFTLPSRVIEPICPGSPFVCDPIAIPAITARQYRISVINPNGMSNSVLFDVTSK